LRRLDCARIRRVLIERPVRAAAVIISHEPGEQRVEMSFIEHDDMIEEFTPKCPDEPLAIWILPRTPRRCNDFLSAHGFEAARHGLTVNAVAVTDQVIGSGLEREGFPKLLADPGRR